MVDIYTTLDLKQGDLIQVKVQASNGFCYSTMSEFNTDTNSDGTDGATVMECPD